MYNVFEEVDSQHLGGLNLHSWQFATPRQCSYVAFGLWTLYFWACHPESGYMNYDIVQATSPYHTESALQHLYPSPRSTQTLFSSSLATITAAAQATLSHTPCNSSNSLWIELILGKFSGLPPMGRPIPERQKAPIYHRALNQGARGEKDDRCLF